ncbi:hypothetical protein [Pseudolysinimonas sp.]
MSLVKYASYVPVRLVAIGVVLFLLTGCADVRQEADVQGAWYSVDEPRSSAKFVLAGDGGIEISNMPRDLLLPGPERSLDDVDWANLISASGNWSITPDGRIDFTIYPSSGGSIYSYIYLDYKNQALSLYLPVGYSDTALLRFLQE